MKNRSALLNLTYLVGVAADLFFIVTHQDSARFYTKPLLMPLLGTGYFLAARPLNSFSKKILLALLFSWMGDVLLMFTDQNELFFIAGLVAFLIAHLFYISYFTKIRSRSTSYFRKRPVLFLAVFAYVVELLYVLWPKLGNLKIPVLIYALVISAMLSTALWQYQRLNNRTATLFIIGAFLFVLSDSMLAVDKFKTSFNHASLLIMFTYLAAQWFICQGSLRHLRSGQSLSG